VEVSNLNSVIESQGRDLEEKIQQMSHFRSVAEIMSKKLDEHGFFERVCTEFTEVFNASVVGVFWIRKRVPAGWWLGAWASESEAYFPTRSIIPHELEGVMSEVWQEGKASYLENLDNETLLDMWDSDFTQENNTVVFPLTASSHRKGLLVVINPQIKISKINLQRHLDILHSLINSGVNNRLLYSSLSESEEEFKDLFESSSDMVIVTYKDGIIRSCNSAFRRTLGLEHDPKGMHFTELIEEDEGEILLDSWNRLLNGEEIRNLDIKLKSLSGESIEAELNGNSRIIPGGPPGIIRLYIRDYTEKRRDERARLKLENEVELNKQRQLAQMGLYVAGIAHNLQNPVQVLLGYIGILKSTGENYKGLNVIEESTSKIMTIIQSLLLKMRKGNDPTETEIDLNGLLENELSFLNFNQFYKHEVEKTFMFDPGLPVIKGVHSDFSQLIMNIVYNALDAMASTEKKVLTIVSEYLSSKNKIVIKIADTGDGIPLDVQKKIFEPFYSTKKDKENGAGDIHSGSGLGLSSTKGILANYNGNLEYTSEPGKGTEFRILIPVE